MEENLEKDMTPVLLEDLGMRYPTEESKERRRYGLYQCQYCGKEFETRIDDIKRGSTKSCGCQCKVGKVSHGYTKHRLYKTWRDMKYRCINPKSSNYKDYGGRGIKVCERWLDINNFIKDMFPSYQEGLSLDRIDVDGDYCLENCRWTTKDIQGQNTRDIMSTNKSGYRGVSWNKKNNKWISSITVNSKKIQVGSFHTALEAAKAYERYVRINNLKHNFTPALTEEEIEEIKTTRKETR